MQRSLPLAVCLAAALFLLLAAYLGSYYALLTGPNFWALGEPPRYKVEGRAVELFFVPANRFDRLVRPDYWKPPRYVY